MLGVDEFSGTKLPCLFRERYPVGHPGHLGNRDPSSPCGLPLVADKSVNHSHQRHTKDARSTRKIEYSFVFFIYNYIYIYKLYIMCFFFRGICCSLPTFQPWKSAMPEDIIQVAADCSTLRWMSHGSWVRNFNQILVIDSYEIQMGEQKDSQNRPKTNKELDVFLKECWLPCPI